MSTGQSAVMLCGWGVKAGWLIPYVHKRLGDSKLCDSSSTHANLSALEVSITHIMTWYTNILFSLLILRNS